MEVNPEMSRQPRAAICGLIFAIFCIEHFAAKRAGAQDTVDFFRQNCANCHTIGGGRLTGPDLMGVGQRKDREWLIKFMMDPQAVLESGDEYAQKILRESRNVPMPKLPGMSRERSEYLLELIEAESELETSQFKGMQISIAPFTDEDRVLGRELFMGRVPLEKGGTSCISCHAMHDIRTLGGGRLGPDLTNVYERLKDRKVLSAWLTAPATETMQPVFKDHPLTPDEIHALVAYFEASAGETPSDPTTSRVSMLLIAVLVAAGMVFGMDAIWKRRFHSVRQPLVDSSPMRGHS
jgi:mono/diheme cytochrome c family protein